jgi:hypothetical protein
MDKVDKYIKTQFFLKEKLNYEILVILLIIIEYITFIPLYIMENQPLNVIFTCDATGSMSSFLTALKEVFGQLLQLFPLLAPDAKFHLMIYRDFDQKGKLLYDYNGPFLAKDVDKMINVIQKTQASGGADGPEAQKYAFGLLLREETIVGPAVVFHFTDAPPHSFPFPKGSRDNHGKEGNALRINDLDQDWIPLCQKYKDRGIPFYSIGHYNTSTQSFYTVMADMTGGEVILLNNSSVDTILRSTVITASCALGYEECDLSNLAKIVQLNTQVPQSEDSNQFRSLHNNLKNITFGGENDFYTMSSTFTICTRKTLEARYKTDPDFQIMCFKIFTKLLQSGHILALTYNPLLGCIYRLMNRRSKVVQTETLRTEINQLMSLTIGKLKTTNINAFNQVQKWQEESYNRLEEINEIIMEFEQLVPFLSLQVAGPRMTKKDLTQACKIPMPHHLRQLGQLISGLFVVTKKPKMMPEVFLPLSADNKTLFSLLSHLMCPGVKLDFIPSIVIALVTLNSQNTILAPRALEFLRDSCGQWFDKEGSEWYLFGIIKLMLKLEREHGQILTKEEIEHLQPLFKISAIKYNNEEFDCTRKFKLVPEHGKWYADHKAKCPQCKEFRSCTVMSENGVCGLCCSYSSEELAKFGDPDAKKSALFDCTSCGSRYGVRNVEGLNTKPKCHYCRQGIAEIPQVLCKCCDVNIILPEGAEITGQTSDEFMCSICCENGGVERFETIQVRMHDLLKENPKLVPWLINLDIEFDLLVGRFSLFKLREKYEQKDVVSPIFELLCGGQPLVNLQEIIDRMVDIVKTGSVGKESCLICYDDKIHTELESVCHNKGCKSLACRDCITSWFSENKPGSRVLENRFLCPTCKRVPAGGLAFVNPHIKVLAKLKPVFDLDWHYAWCKSCGKIKEYMERQCVGPDPMEIHNFQCEECMHPGINKSCPNCGILTVKESGCDKLTCSLCHKYWCYRCEEGDVFQSDIGQDVYEHLYAVHGDIYGGAEDDEYDY